MMKPLTAIIWVVLFGMLLLTLSCAPCKNYSRAMPEDAVWEVWYRGSWYFTIEKPAVVGWCLHVDDIELGQHILCGHKPVVAPAGTQWGRCNEKDQTSNR